jgi:decaprenylphospho-beta-D-erythro-pentofuranosid-2-ulose 2-reductase
LEAGQIVNDPSAGTRVVILGATSAIAEAAARLWARDGAYLVLVGRNAERLRAIADDLRIRGAAAAHAVVLDLASADAQGELDRMANLIGFIDVVLLAYGVLGDQVTVEQDPVAARKILTTDFLSAADWCLATANYLAARRAGVLIVIGSVAGDRGRMSNYIYGAAKGGLGILTQGIAHRLAPTGARAVLIKPGFVDTPMTAHMGSKGILWSRPEVIAAVIKKAAQGGGPILYAPGWWRFIMLIIRLVPWKIAHKTKL